MSNLLHRPDNVHRLEPQKVNPSYRANAHLYVTSSIKHPARSGPAGLCPSWPGAEASRGSRRLCAFRVVHPLRNLASTAKPPAAVNLLL